MNLIFDFQLEASFRSNVAVIEANCERVEARVNALLEKFETKERWWRNDEDDDDDA